MNRTIAAASAAVLSLTLAAGAAVAQDFRALAQQDLQAAHDALAANHPAAVVPGAAGDGFGHGEIRLAGASGSDAKDDGVLVDRVDIPLLPKRLGPNRAPSVGDDIHGQHIGRALFGLLAKHLNGALNRVAVQRLPGLDDGQ